MNYNTNQLTGWINGYQKPVRDGIYERDYTSYYGEHKLGFALYKDGKWYCGYNGTYEYTLRLVRNEVVVSILQDLPWRGLNFNPEETNG